MEFQTTIHHPENGLDRLEAYQHYHNEWERLNRLAKLACAANEEESTIESIYCLMDEVTTMLVELVE